MPEEKNIEKHIVGHLLENKEEVADSRLHAWLDESTENRTTFSKFKKIWGAVDNLFSAKQFDTKEGWAKVNQSIQSSSIKQRRINQLLYATAGMAASLLVIIGLGLLTGQFSSTNNKIELATGYGSTSEIVLPDGSVVHMNSGSNLSYHFNKKTKTREINFSGEGYFEVAKNNRPFVVETPEGMKVEVLGTQFNLSAYPDDKIVQTTLIEGKVELSNPSGEKLLMVPGQIVKFNKQTQKLNYLEGNPSHKLGWMEQKIYLDNSSLAETCKKLERMYDVRISFYPSELGEQIHHTGVLREETIYDVLEALTELSEIKYKLKGKEITIMPK